MPVAGNIIEHRRLAAVYDALDGVRDDLENYVAIVDELGARRMLDVGCGTGTFAVILAGRGLDVVAVDPSFASLEVARAKVGADRVRWIHGDASSLPDLCVDLATMTANVAQAIVTHSDWKRTLNGIHDALAPGGHLVFETRNPAFRAWREWNRDSSYTRAEVLGLGAVESWHDVTAVSGSIVTFRSTCAFPDGEVVITDSTLRFRTREQIETDLARHHFVVDEVRDAPDRPGPEFVFIAHRPD